MGRQVWRMHKAFDWPLNEVWQGYCLDAVLCPMKRENHDGCPVCHDTESVSPVIEPPGWELGEEPQWLKEGRIWADKYGWQMWETVTEGAPISPVCDTPEALAHWLADNAASAFGKMTASYEQWLAMIKGGGSAPSAVLSAGGIESGVAGMFGERGMDTSP